MHRSFQLILLFTCSVLFVSAAVQQSVSQQSLDGVCKAASMPPGFVAVGEMDSPECKEGVPNQKNAWLIDKIQDGIISCTPPAYASGYPPAIAYVTCERAHSASCQPSLDGSPNAFVLKKGSTCRAARVKSFCWSAEATPNQVPSSPYYTFPPVLKNNPDEELYFFKLAIIRNDPTCSNKNGEGPDRAFYVDFLAKNESLPLCAAFNYDNSRYRNGLEGRLQLSNALESNNKIIITRQFHTDMCPEYLVDGVRQPLNAFVLRRLSREDWVNKDVFMCSLSLPKKVKIPLEIQPGSGGYSVRQTAAEAFQEKGTYEVQKVYQDDRCGTEPATNAYSVRFVDFATPESGGNQTDTDAQKTHVKICNTGTEGGLLLSYSISIDVMTDKPMPYGNFGWVPLNHGNCHELESQRDGETVVYYYAMRWDGKDIQGVLPSGRAFCARAKEGSGWYLRGDAASNNNCNEPDMRPRIFSRFDLNGQPNGTINISEDMAR